MNEPTFVPDKIDRRILQALQRRATLSQRELAEIVGLSQNACWRRLHALRQSGIITSDGIRLDAARLGLTTTVFVMIKTRHHSRDWLQTFRQAVCAIDNVIDFYRIAGEYDYMLKVLVEDMNAFDRVYQRLIERVELDAVTSYVAMEAIADARPAPL